MNQPSSKFQKYYSPLIGAALAAASLFHFSLPAFSIGTTAGTGLVNSATATYDDQDNNSYDVTSNEVTVTVGKIAGITNVLTDFSDNTSTAGGSTAILPGDEVHFDFEITNTGNDATDIFIPDLGDIAVQNLTVDAVEYVVIDSGGNEVVIARGGSGTVDGNAVNFTGGIVEDVPQNTSIVIRVTATVSATAADGDDISVQLGDTGTNTADVNSTDYPGTQNQADLGATGDVQATDVRTQTADGAIVQVTGDPVNGQREASATAVRTVGSESLALAKLEKTNAGVADGADPNDLTDNIVTYNLNLEVAGNTDPQVAAYTDFPFNAADLEGRAYTTAAPNFAKDATTPGTFDGGIDTSNLILISDAIPENTNLEVGGVVAPAGGAWIPVYTESPLTTPADNAAWTTTAPATQGEANDITRVGWVYDAEADGALAAGSNTIGFGFDVITTGINTAGAVYNIGQVFGSTDDGVAGASGLITYDESGDQNPANLNDDGTFGPDETATIGGEFGVADPEINDNGTPGDPSDDFEENVDTNNDNTATGSEAGEVNKVEVNPVAVVSAIFNGPDGNADAVGDIFGAAPADDNHDFQNLAAESPVAGTATALTELDDNGDGHPNSTYDPNAVTFDNTVENPGDSTINSIILEPVSPEALLGAGAASLGGDETDLPDGTTITIVYDDGVNPVQTAIYTYDTTAANLITIDAVNSDGTGTDGAVVIPSIPRNSSVPYTVSVDLPTGTELSTNFEGGDPANDLVGAYPAVIAAYINDVNPTTTGLTINDTYNVTVNQVYTGYLQLLKKARVLRDAGSGFVEVAGMGFDDPDGDKEPAPGDILEYQITYTNISEDGATGTGNGLLQADDIVITEDGVPSATNDNNWANDNDDPAEDGDTLIDTLHPLSGANDTTTGSVITYFNAADIGNTNPGSFSSELVDFGVTDDIVKYEVSGITRLSPGDSGVFTFQRKITSPADIEDLAP